MKKFLIFHWFHIFLFSILLLAVVLRFYNYTNRWGLATDQAHDALVARSALANHSLPSVGPFSSAGPFVMGPEWYYFIMAATAVYPPSPITPWVILTLSYIFMVYLMILLGKELKGKRFGIILGFITAVSTVQITQAINLTNQAPLSVLAAIALWAIVKYLKTKKEWYLFLASFSVSVGVNTHLQGVLLIPLLIATIIVSRPSWKGFFLSLVSFFIPFLPLLQFDIVHDNWELKNMTQYYFHDQYKIGLDQFGRRWTTYLGVFWPTVIAEMIGGIKQVVYLVLVADFGFGLYSLWEKKITKFVIIYISTIIIAVVFLRYTHTPLFSSYLMFINPFIFILFGFVIESLFEVNIWIGLLAGLIIISMSFVRDINQMKNSQNYTAFQANQWKNVLYATYPNEKFAMYDYQYRTTVESLALSLFLTADGRIDNKGRKIGVAIYTGKFYEHSFKKILRNGDMGYQMMDLNSSSSAKLDRAGWAFVNPDGIYKAAEAWYK